MFNRKTKTKTIKKIPVIVSTGKGYKVHYITPRKTIHNGDF
jgi:hypothetical protein